MVFIGLFYLVYPLNSSLPGDFDTWGNLAMFKEMMLAIDAPFTGAEYGDFSVLNDNSWVNYGLDFFTGVIWVFFFKLGLNEIWAYWAYLTVLLALNSLGFFVFSKHFVKSYWLRWFFGLLFSLHFFVYLTIDNPNILSYFFFFLSLDRLFVFFETKRVKTFYSYSLFAAIQIYCSPVVFVFLFFTSLFFFLYSFKKEKISLYIKASPGLLLLLLLIAPYIYIYFIGLNGLGQYDTLSYDHWFAYNNVLALKFDDIFRFYPGHLFYFGDEEILPRFMELKYLFPGLAIFGMFVVSLFYSQRRLLHVYLLFVFLLGCGEYLYLSESYELKSPFYFVYHTLGLSNVLRNPSRFSMLVLMAYLLIAAQLIERARKMNRLQFNNWKFIVLASFIFFESLAYSKTLYKDSPFLALSKPQLFYPGMFTQGERLLSVPTGSLGIKDAREMFYMYQRSFQQIDIINGTQAVQNQRIDVSQQLVDTDFCSFAFHEKISTVILYCDLVYDEKDQAQLRAVMRLSCFSYSPLTESVFLFVRKK